MDLLAHIQKPTNSKAAAILDQILPAFEDAVIFSERGTWVEELRSTNAALEMAKSLSFFRGPQVYLSARLSLIEAGLLFRGSQPIGDITPMSANQFMLQSQSVLSGMTHRADTLISVWSDRIICGADVHPIDTNTTASVFVDGAEQVIQRPTLTRMALLSPLPGTALIPGMAFQKKSKVDTREVTFSVTSAKWQFTCRTHPDLMAQSKSIAERINAIASELGSQVEVPQARTDKIEQIKEIKSLLDDGALSLEEFNELKSQILSQP